MASAYAATHLESMCKLDIDSQPHVHRMSGIVCTIGMNLICHYLSKVDVCHRCNFLENLSKIANNKHILSTTWAYQDSFNRSLFSGWTVHKLVFDCKFRSSLSICGHAAEDDECRHERCSSEFLARDT